MNMIATLVSFVSVGAALVACSAGDGGGRASSESVSLERFAIDGMSLDDYRVGHPEPACSCRGEPSQLCECMSACMHCHLSEDGSFCSCWEEMAQEGGETSPVAKMAPHPSPQPSAAPSPVPAPEWREPCDRECDGLDPAEECVCMERACGVPCRM